MYSYVLLTQNSQNSVHVSREQKLLFTSFGNLAAAISVDHVEERLGIMFRHVVSELPHGTFPFFFAQIATAVGVKVP